VSPNTDEIIVPLHVPDMLTPVGDVGDLEPPQDDATTATLITKAEMAMRFSSSRTIMMAQSPWRRHRDGYSASWEPPDSKRGYCSVQAPFLGLD
jgi:hypothetical protein